MEPIQSDHSRLSVESRALKSVLSVFCTQLGFWDGYSAGSHRNRFEDIRRVRLSIQSSELGLLPELGPQNYSYCSSHPEMLS
eukprot:7594281-Pyramimonas_sp.AAC.1